MEIREAHVEQLIGRRVVDANGEILGRLEEFHVEIVDGEPVVTDFRIGPAALFERMGGFIVELPVLRLLPIPQWEYCVSWELVDLSDPDHPRVRVARAELPRTQLSARS